MIWGQAIMDPSIRIKEEFIDDIGEEPQIYLNGDGIEILETHTHAQMESIQTDATHLDEGDQDEEEECYVDIDEEDEEEITAEDNEAVEDSVLMPYRALILKTKPQIKIHKNFQTLGPLYVPPSTCTMSIHERFTEIQVKLLKKQINPVFGFAGHQRALRRPGQRASAFSRLGYYHSRYNKAQYLAAQKLKKKYLKQGASVHDRLGPIEGGGVYFKEGRWRRKFRWFHRKVEKSKEELDDEIESYHNDTIKIKEGALTEAEAAEKIAKELAAELADSDDEETVFTETEDDTESQLGATGGVPKSKFAKMMSQIKGWGKTISKAELDNEMDQYFASNPAVNGSNTEMNVDIDELPSRKDLDEEMDHYWTEKNGNNGEFAIPHPPQNVQA